MTATRIAAPKHPAKFSDPIVDRLRVLVQAEKRRVLGRTSDGPIWVLDPFAGVGRVHRLAARRGQMIETVGIEIEPEWAACHERTLCADSLSWMREHPYLPDLGNWRWVDDTPNGFDIIVTSPTYGNRFADHHEARDRSTRRSYRHDLGRMPSTGSSAVMPWGRKYWEFHAEAYRLMFNVLVPGGLALINVSDFYKGKALVSAVSWHRGAAMGAGFVTAGRDVLIETGRLRGVGKETTAARAPYEVILRLRRPPTGQEDTNDGTS